MCGSTLTLAHHSHAGDGELYMCGSNESSQLATKDVKSMAVPKRTAALDTRVVDTVACGSNFTVAVTREGVLMGWGSGEFGQIGSPVVVGQQVPRLIKGIAPAARIERVAAGTAHVLALSEQFQVFSFGFGLHGALGHGNNESMCADAALNLHANLSTCSPQCSRPCSIDVQCSSNSRSS